MIMLHVVYAYILYIGHDFYFRTFTRSIAVFMSLHSSLHSISFYEECLMDEQINELKGSNNVGK